MNAVKRPEPLGTSYSEPSQATQMRELLGRAGLSQREAARELQISDREMRGYCTKVKVPRVVILALERLVDLGRHVGD